MFPTEQYELLDFGHGRKLERFADVLLDRPAPAATGIATGGPALWNRADARFSRSDGADGRWTDRGHPPPRWTVRHGAVVLELNRTGSGAIGVYPEQAENWDWIERQLRGAQHPLKVLNLFAYTGGSTLAAAAAGAEVVHVDASRSAVAWARRSAALSGLATAPIRWIVEDARTFAEREIRRRNQYDAIILDPPSYGHGPQTEAWKLDLHLYSLLRACGQLTSSRRAFILLTCHSPDIGPTDLAAMLADTIFGHSHADVRAKRLILQTRDGRRLDSGVAARWPS